MERQEIENLLGSHVIVGSHKRSSRKFIIRGWKIIRRVYKCPQPACQQMLFTVDDMSKMFRKSADDIRKDIRAGKLFAQTSRGETRPYRSDYHSVARYFVDYVYPGGIR